MKSITFVSIFLTLFSFQFYSCDMPYGIPDDAASKTFLEMIEYTTKDNDGARITAGIIKNRTMDYTVYGENGSKLPQIEYVYEIGSVTKTITSSLLCKAISENKTTLNDTIDKYINVSGNHYYPPFRRLVTHTSGYRGYYFDLIDTANSQKGNGNQYYGISTNRLNNQINNNLLNDKSYPFFYSNFGISVVGYALASIYGNNYATIIDNFIISELGLAHTKVSDGTGDLSGYWKWNTDDAYLPAGGLVSTITDMMKYVNLHMTDGLPYLALGHTAITEINAAPKEYLELGIRMDSAGIGWIVDRKNDIIWHNGGTSNFNTYIAFNKQKQIGVVILSNLSPNYGISATIMGVKLMSEL